MTVNGYRVSLGVDENVVEFWLVVTVPLCEYNENSCTLKKKKPGGHCPRLPWDTEVPKPVLGVLVPTLDTCPVFVLIAAEAVSLPPAWGPGPVSWWHSLPVDSSASEQVRRNQPSLLGEPHKLRVRLPTPAKHMVAPVATGT